MVWVEEFVDSISDLDWIWCEEAWWMWDAFHGVWLRKKKQVLHKVYYAWCKAHAIDDAKDYKKDAMDRLEAELYRELWSDLEAPGFTNFKNGMFCHKTKELVPFQAGFYSREQLNIKFEPGPTPCWDQVWAVYEHEIDLLERVIHSMLVKDHNDECMVFGIGPTGSGKGTISQILGIALGKMASHTKLNDLGGGFGLYPLVGKRANLDREGEIGWLNARAVSYLKDIVTHEGPMEINCKKVPQFDADLDIWFFTFLNQLYTLPNGTDRKAFFRRIVLLELNKTQPKNPAFKESVGKETSAIISNICMKELKPVFPQGFDVDEYVKTIATKWDLWSQPVHRIVDQLFEYSDQPLDTLDVVRVNEWVDTALRKEGLTENQEQLKGKITMYLSLMKIHSRQKNKQRIYYNIKAKDADILQQLKNEEAIEASEKEDTKGGMDAYTGGR